MISIPLARRLMPSIILPVFCAIAVVEFAMAAPGQPEQLRTRVDALDVEPLKSAIRDLSSSFPNDYARGDEFLARIDQWKAEMDAVSSKLESTSETEITRAESLLAEFEQLRREALIGNPLVSGQPLLYVVRRQYKPDHHNTATLFQTGEINTSSFEGGGALKTIDFARNGEVKTVIDVTDGIARDPELHFDGKKIIFSMRKNIADDYHIYEINVDGAGLRQLTRMEGVADIDPLYLPDDNIVFSSTREPKFCMCNRHIMANLFRMEPDGANIHQIGKSTLFEGHSALMPDGRILYDRWEYVDRNFGDAQGLWTVNPDGTSHAIYWGNNTWSPGGVIDARPIPGTQSVLCVFGSCHDRPWGALAIVDRRLGLDDRAPVVRTWPSGAINLVWPGGTEGREGYGFDTFIQVNPKYEDPYPLSDKYFLCSRATGNGEQMGIYLIDVFGNEILLHVEDHGCFDPMPVAPRFRPPTIPSRPTLDEPEGSFYVANVYNGTHMEGVQPGVVKYLRVVESPEKRFWVDPLWEGQGRISPAMNWHDFNNKRILGTVPVQADGSAYFSVPAGRFIYFQLLDEKGMMIQSMRSGTIVQPGERMGCVGCHDNRRIAPPSGNQKTPLAVQSPPVRLDGWHGEARFFNYMAEVQPVFDQYCVECHDYGKRAGEKLNLSGDRTETFNTSYNELWRKGYIKAIGAGPVETQQAYSWGSHKSKLMDKIIARHKGVELDPESFDRVATWIDINGPYYPVYASAYRDNLAGRLPIDNTQLEELTTLTGVPFAQLANHAKNRGPQINLARPKLSPCLDNIPKKKTKDYRRALAIIQAGADNLRNKPRADMPGFTLEGIEAAREEKYIRLQSIENRNREAILSGTKQYD